jgi:hypothetical protein
MSFPAMQSIPKWVLALCLAPLIGRAAAAQTYGSLSGAVQDTEGKPVSGARVTLTIMDSPAACSSTGTSREGTFSFHALRPASYALTVEAASFGRQTLEGVKINAAAETSLPPIRLAPSASEAATAPIVVARANREQAGGLPLPEWNSFHLLDLLPGVHRNGRAPLAIYGESSSLGAITYDGIDVQKTLPRSNGVDFEIPPLRAAQVGEAFVVTGDITGCGCARAGFEAPTGSNALHGSAYGLFLPAGAAAQYWADNSRSAPSSRSIGGLGASLGGALKKNQLYFFGSYEAALNRSAITRTGEAALHPLTSRDPLAQQVLGLIPSDPTGRYLGWQNNGGWLATGLARLDYAASGRHALGVTVLDYRGSTDDPAGSSVFGRNPATSMSLSSQTYAVSWRWSPSARLTNEFRAGGSLSRFGIRNALRSRFDFIAILRDPKVAVSQPMAGLDPQEREDQRYSYQDDLAWIAGKHSVQAGFWLQQHRLRSKGVDHGLLDSGAVPRYVVSDIAQGVVSKVSQRFNVASAGSGYSSGAPAGSELSTKMIAGYLHDTWRLLSSLSVNLGLRFDWLAPAQVRSGAAIIPVLSAAPSDSVYDKKLPFTFASTREFYRNDQDNYALYVGLAWRPAKGLPLVVRGSSHLSTLNDHLLTNMSFLALQNPFQNFDVAVDLAPAPLSGRPAVPAPAAPA